MKILLISDYFYPFTPGGAEWSVYELAKALKVKKIDPVIATINYGALALDNYRGLRIRRIPFLKKLTRKRSIVNPIWQNNPVFFLISAYFLIKYTREEHPDILHVHGKFLIPASIIAGLFTKKPVIITIRDKQILCSWGKCFFEKDRYNACGWKEYLTVDLNWYYQNYVKSKNLAKLVYTYISAIWTRLSFWIIVLFAKRADVIIAISQSQKRYLTANGFEKVEMIYNISHFSLPQIKPAKSKTILFVGKLSIGKGGLEFIEAIPKVLKKLKATFIVAGTLDLKDQVEKIKFLGAVEHQKLSNLYKNSSVVVMPSIYPEAFGRVALEAVSAGTPVIVSNRGALPEIIEDKKTGRVIEVTSDKLEKAIIDVVDEEFTYRKNIKESYQKLIRKFYEEPVEKHLQLYQRLTI